MISINFASRNYRLAERITTTLLAAAAFFAVVALAIVLFALHERADLNTLTQKLKELKTAEEAYRPLLLERDRIVKDLAAMSGLTAAKRFSWTQFLSDIETIVPVGVAIDRLDYNPHDHVVKLDGRAQSPESLRNLIVALEHSTRFKDSYLKHQSIEKGSISFNVVVSYQEHAAAAVDPGK